jgi:hypothetical protein
LQHSNPMLTVAGVWPDWRLETNLLCLARQAGVVGRQHASRIAISVAADVNSLCGRFLLPCLESVQTVRLCRFWLQCVRGLRRGVHEAALLKSEFRHQLVSEPASKLAVPVKPKYEKAVLSGSSPFCSSCYISETKWRILVYHKAASITPNEFTSGYTTSQRVKKLLVNSLATSE